MHRGAEGGARERQLGDGRVEDPLWAVLVVEARRSGEDPARYSDVLAEENTTVSVIVRSQRKGERPLEQLA